MPAEHEEGGVVNWLMLGGFKEWEVDSVEVVSRGKAWRVKLDRVKY